MSSKWDEYKEKFCGCKDGSSLNSCKGLPNCSLRADHPERKSAAPVVERQPHEWDINEHGTATVCSICGIRSSDEPPELAELQATIDQHAATLQLACRYLLQAKAALNPTGRLAKDIRVLLHEQNKGRGLSQ
jgi:hypothetical protein